MVPLNSHNTEYYKKLSNGYFISDMIYLFSRFKTKFILRSMILTI